MTFTPQQIVEAALRARTLTEAANVQEMIASRIGATHRRPVGDKQNNFGLMGSSGSYDLKLIENVTNMQDSVIERFSLLRHGSRENIRYEGPHEAARDLFGSASPRDLSKLVTVTFRESDPPTDKSKRLTAVFRDKGCGMEPSVIPYTIFGLGGSHKEDALFLQGAFGLGGTMTYRNAGAVVLVTRRDPALLDLDSDDDADRIAVAVVQWQTNTKGQTAYYLVDRPWNAPGDIAEPWSCSSADYSDFEPGTHLALISYRVDGFHRRREGDEKSFDVVTNTRLFAPVLPVRFVNETSRAERATTLEGLSRRLERSDHEFGSGEEILPFHHEGRTYHLPVRYVLFEKPRTAGGRDKFVAHDHSVLFTSNGQVHHHWTPREVRDQTGLNRLYDRILVIVETDELPIQLRTSLFTADRNELVRGDAALRLEDAVRGFIREWTSLREANNALIRDSLRDRSSQPTAEIARRIGRALPFAVKGFASGPSQTGSGRGNGNGSGRAGGGGGSHKPIILRPDPTSITGPARVQAVTGQTKSITYTVDAEDSFFDGRGVLQITCDHAEIEPRAITVGKGRNGRVRVMIAVPETAELGTYELRVVLDNWMRVAGGLGPRMEHVTKLELVEEIGGKGAGNGKPTKGANGTSGPIEGGNVALKWTDHEKQETWERITVGAVEDIPAQILAEQNEEYAELHKLGDVAIPTILLNQEYPPFKKYLASRNRELTTVERPMEQYAVGVGVSLLLIHQELERMKANDTPLPNDSFIEEAHRAAASAVLAVMPAFDEIAKEAGLTD
ncbi:hypothetical protein [Nonomuraea sp. NPDC049480]|uniref:hypothetical protein n=1 Tax=Nonomuraea sp. NPDC049480 TaxID=3364353 RepID=UPI0037AEF64D